MAASIYPDYPSNLTIEQSANLLSTLKDWSIAHGLAVRPSPAFVSKEIDPESVLAVTAPVTLFPSPFPRSCFEEGCVIQKGYNELYAAISRDEQWLEQIVKEVIDVDDFIEKLWTVHLKVKEEGYTQSLSLGLFRSDYMVHFDPSDTSAPPQIKQVEFNTIASSFGGLASQVSSLHKHLLATSSYPPDPILAPSALPPNEATASLAGGLAAAHAAYGPSKSQPHLPLCIVFVVQSPERNIFDQRHLEYHLQLAHEVPVFRLNFSDVLSRTHISDSHPSRPLIYTAPYAPSTPYEVTVLYLRATYTPADYLTPDAWRARYHIERSAAIKCPSILTHLAGTKKVQQVLANPAAPEVLERFLPDARSRENVRKTFTAIYPLDDSPSGREAKKLALGPETSSKFVLKPQREGGGNNIYRGAIPPFLKGLGREEKWRGHILMEMIEPPAQRNSLFRDGVVKTGEVIAELGIYGTCLWRADGEVLHNKEAGYLLRTKGRESEEGGVAAGYGAVDSVCLIDL